MYENWTLDQWSAESEALLDIAKAHFHPEWKYGEVVILKTANNNVYTLEIPDFQKAEVREPLENQWVQQLLEQEDTAVILCIATVTKEGIPEIPSWNLRSKLVEINEANLQARTVLWVGEKVCYIRKFSDLLPPKKE